MENKWWWAIFFNGATIINANVKGLTADQISHDALKTIDEVDGATINYTLNKNEWLSNDLLNQFDSNHINRENYNIICDGNSYDFFLKTDNTDQYLIYDTNSYSQVISAGNNKVLHTWTNTFGYPVLVSAKATLGGSLNEIVWEITNGSNPRYLEWVSNTEIVIILRENETLQCRGHSWALWGSQTAYVNYVKFHKTFSGGRQHHLQIFNRELKNILIENNTETQQQISILSINIPSWVDYFYIYIGNFDGNWCFYDKAAYVNFVYKIDGGEEISISPLINFARGHISYFKIDCTSFNSNINLTLIAYVKGDVYLDDNKNEKKITARLNIRTIDYGAAIYLSGNPDSYALFDTTRREKKYFIKDLYYKNNLVIGSDNSISHLTKVNKADFITSLYNSISSDLRDNWLVLTDSTTHYITIDGVNTNIVQLFITNSYIKAMLSNGEVATLIQETRYYSLSLYCIVAGSTESIETGHIIPKTSNRTIGNSTKPFQSAHINVVNATEVHGKVYAS